MQITFKRMWCVTDLFSSKCIIWLYVTYDHDICVHFVLVYNGCLNCQDSARYFCKRMKLLCLEYRSTVSYVTLLLCPQKININILVIYSHSFAVYICVYFQPEFNFCLVLITVC